MRIIAGKLGGRRLVSAKTAALRPISDRIKQSLFDIITGLCPGANFLDLFAGTGAVGLEALSRGARFACFVESNKDCLEAIRRNVADLALEPAVKILKGSARGDLSWVAFRSGQARYEMVFLGPPYKDKEKRPLSLSSEVCSGIVEAGLLASGGIIISQHHAKEEVEPPAGYEIFRRNKYGDSFLSFLRRSAAGGTSRPI